jgi:iron complex outermembrane recepter protein
VNNTGLKPWTADNYDLALESYHIKDGFGSIGVFQKDISNFFGSTSTPATPELLALYGIPDDQLYQNYTITTQTNVGAAKITGFEFTYRQSLTFLPQWARGFQAYFNTTQMHLGGSTTADFTGFNPSSLAGGINFIRSRYFIKLSCTYQGETKRGLAAVNAANGIPANTYTYQGERTRVTLSARYNFLKNLAIYGSFTDLGGGFNPLSRIYAPNTPSYARRNRFQELGSTITVGIMGQF